MVGVWSHIDGRSLSDVLPYPYPPLYYHRPQVQVTTPLGYFNSPGQVGVVVFHVINQSFLVLVTTKDGVTDHSVPECGFEGLKMYQAPAHIWDLPR